MATEIIKINATFVAYLSYFAPYEGGDHWRMVVTCRP